MRKELFALIVLGLTFSMMGKFCNVGSEADIKIIAEDTITKAGFGKATALTIKLEKGSRITVRSVSFRLETCDGRKISPMSHSSAISFAGADACDYSGLFPLAFTPCKLVFDLPSGCYKDLSYNIRYTKL